MRKQPEALDRDLVLARIADEVTLKRLQRIDAETVELQPVSTNPEHKPIEIGPTTVDAEDLTDPAVRTAPEIACEQNCPEERRLVGFKRSPLGYGWGTDADLKERIAEAHVVLHDNPKHCDTRTKRRMAMIGLACLNRRRSWCK